jgi:hypothetical protein
VGGYRRSSKVGKNGVSIQLVSPTSGEITNALLRKWLVLVVSIQLVSPTSGESRISTRDEEKVPVSIQLVSPTSGER